MQTERQNLLNSLIEPDELVTPRSSFQNTQCFDIITCLDSYHRDLVIVAQFGKSVQKNKLEKLQIYS